MLRQEPSWKRWALNERINEPENSTAANVQNATSNNIHRILRIKWQIYSFVWLANHLLFRSEMFLRNAGRTFDNYLSPLNFTIHKKYRHLPVGNGTQMVAHDQGRCDICTWNTVTNDKKSRTDSMSWDPRDLSPNWSFWVWRDSVWQQSDPERSARCPPWAVTGHTQTRSHNQ